MKKIKPPCYCDAYAFPHRANSAACHRAEPLPPGDAARGWEFGVDPWIVAMDNAERARDMNAVGGW